jgi:hypothetical protein
VRATALLACNALNRVGCHYNGHVLYNTVQVNGKMITSLGTRVDARKDDILVDGKRVSLRSKQETVWVAIHKPKVSTHFYVLYILCYHNFVACSAV